MNDEIRSAREIAMAKIAAMEEATESDRLKWKYVPDGEQMALRFINEGQEITSALAALPEAARRYAASGAENVLLSNIQVPRNETIAARNNLAMDGMVALKMDKAAVTDLLNRLKQILEHYVGQGAEQRQRTYETLKQQYEARLKQAADKLGAGHDEALGISVETLPQFKEEWRHVSSQMEGQYIQLIEEYKRELRLVK
ncbi:MAG: hypothetical protein FWF18_01515 [Dehalococcoidia bacterium]|nr:hypothetical protein [Dehalococcoidia bacterium]